MKNSLFYARPDTCEEALRANKLSCFPVKGVQRMGEWLEQRKELGKKIRKVMRRNSYIEVPESVVTREQVNLCDLNDYP